MSKSIKRIAFIVTIGTLISKTGGLLRQLVIAGAFGIGSAYDAYNYAYILPGFFLILLGGINGPFHNAIVTVLSRKTIQEGKYIANSINTIVSSFLILLSLFLIIGADPLITILAPGLTSEVHHIAVFQLQIMSPITFISGLIGIGFGYLNVKNEFLIPSISPIISSLILIISVSSFWILEKGGLQSSELALKGGLVLAVATLLGAILQFIIQIPSLINNGLSFNKFIFDFKHPGVKEVLNILGPATFSSGMLQINVFTDLFFASGIAGAAAGLSYANFIIQAPLGLVSNIILIPLLPSFSRLSKAENKNELKIRIRQGLMLSSASMIALAAIFISVGDPIVELIYERGAFNQEAANLVRKLLIAYSIGMPAYLGRDLLVRVFYALGDAKTPFNLSAIGIWLNIFFDWFLIGGPSPWGEQLPFNFGTSGIVLATVLINFLTCGALLIKLNLKLKSIPIKQWLSDLFKLLISGMFSGLVTWGFHSIINWPRSFINLFIEVSLCGALGLFAFTLSSNYFKINEVNQIKKILLEKIYSLSR
tara:strand:- start:29172 stop:30785 length:1614 start_codon:yes stop_codon:yes gene_type:complete